MADSADFPASFVPGRKGSPLLMDEHNHQYRIHSKTGPDSSIAFYRCVHRDFKKCPATASLNIASGRIIKFNHSHCHSSNLLKEIARAEETRMIAAAVAVGRISTKTMSANAFLLIKYCFIFAICSYSLVLI